MAENNIKLTAESILLVAGLINAITSVLSASLGQRITIEDLPKLMADEEVKRKIGDLKLKEIVEPYLDK